MAVPATTGVLRAKVADMQVGDYIVCNYAAASGAVGTFSNMGGTAGTEIPVVGSATPNGTFYFVKADKGLLIADRVIQHSITWDTMNTGKIVQGLPWDAGNIIPTMTSNTAPSGVASASSISGAANDAWKVFDKSVTTFWATATNVTVATLSYDFSIAKVVTKYTITTRDTTPTMAPRSWTFEGSNDNTNWNVLDRQIGQNATVASEKRLYVFANNTTYRYYRINVTESNSTQIMISELEMMATAGTIRSLTGGVSYADANGNSVNIAPSPQLGGWPTNSGYDKYLIQSNLNGTITANDINVWHHNAVQTWTQDTPALAIAVSTNRVSRGGSAGVKNMQNSASSTANTGVGLRPAFQYQE